MTSDQRPHGPSSDSDSPEAVPVIEIPDFPLRSTSSTEGAQTSGESDTEQQSQVGRTSVIIKTDDNDPTDIRVVIDAPHLRTRNDRDADDREAPTRPVDPSLDEPELVVEPVPSPQMTPMPPPPAATDIAVEAETAAVNASESAAKSGTLILLFASLATFGLAMRLWIATTSFGFLDSEESVIVLMAKAFREGDFSAFLWGQNYGGTVEVLLTTAIGALTGFGAIAAKLAPATFLLGSCVMLWLIGRRLFDHSTGVIAAALLWAGPLSLLLLSTKAYGNLMAMLFFSLTALYCIVIHQRRPTALTALAGGLSAGVALWCGPQSLALLVPATVWMLATNLRSFRYVSLGAFGLLAGILPFFAGALKNDFATFGRLQFSWGATVDRLQAFFTTGFPLLLGTKLPHTTAWLAPVVGILLTVLLVGTLVLGGILTSHRHPEFRRSLALLALCLVLSPVVLSLLPIELGAPDGHHLVMLWAPLMLFVAACFGRFRVTMATTVMVLGVASMVMLLTNPGTSTTLRPGDLTAVVANLEARGADATFADESIAYRLVESSDEKIIATPIAHNRNHALIRGESTVPGITNYVTREGSLRDQALSLYVEERHLVHQRDVVGDFAVYQIATTLELSDMRTQLLGLPE